MKNVPSLPVRNRIRRAMSAIIFAVSLLLFSVLAWAQDVPEKVEVDIDTGGTSWYGQPWVWAVGVALFIIVIVALTRTCTRRSD